MLNLLSSEILQNTYHEWESGKFMYIYSEKLQYILVKFCSQRLHCQ